MENSEINLNLLGVKAQTKNELYRLLSFDAKLYLSTQKETSIYFIRGIVNGRKKVSYINGFLIFFRHFSQTKLKYDRFHTSIT